MKLLLVFLVLLLPRAAPAQVPPVATTREIEQLFSALEQSDCQFYRNGSWYGPGRASAHLRRKYDYLLKKGVIDSAETFIGLAASKSSLSGKPYLVRCGRSAPIESRLWFERKLTESRASRARGSDSSKPTSPGGSG